MNEIVGRAKCWRTAAGGGQRALGAVQHAQEGTAGEGMRNDSHLLQEGRRCRPHDSGVDYHPAALRGERGVHAGQVLPGRVRGRLDAQHPAGDQGGSADQGDLIKGSLHAEASLPAGCAPAKCKRMSISMEYCSAQRPLGPRA